MSTPQPQNQPNQPQQAQQLSPDQSPEAPLESLIEGTPLHLLTEEQIRERLRESRELQFSSQARQAFFRGGKGRSDEDTKEKQAKLDVFDEL